MSYIISYIISYHISYDIYYHIIIRGQTDRGYKKPVTNTDIEIAIPLGMKRIPDSVNQYSFRYETDTG